MDEAAKAERKRLWSKENKKRQRERLLADPVAMAEHLRIRREQYQAKMKARRERGEKIVFQKKRNKGDSAFKIRNTAHGIARMNIDHDLIPNRNKITLTEAAEFLGLDPVILMFKSMEGLAPPYTVGRPEPTLKYDRKQIEIFKEIGTWQK